MMPPGHVISCNDMHCVLELVWPPAVFGALHVGQQMDIESDFHRAVFQGEVPDQVLIHNSWNMQLVWAKAVGQL